MSWDPWGRGVRQTGARMPLYPVLAGGLGPPFISLGFSFLICKMQTIAILTLRDCSENYKALRTILRIQ